MRAKQPRSYYVEGQVLVGVADISLGDHKDREAIRDRVAKEVYEAVAVAIQRSPWKNIKKGVKRDEQKTPTLNGPLLTTTPSGMILIKFHPFIHLHEGQLRAFENYVTCIMEEVCRLVNRHHIGMIRGVVLTETKIGHGGFAFLRA